MENRIAKALWHSGYRLRRNVKDLLGKPDIAIKKYKAVIFLDSCFWHGCELHCVFPKSNTEYWEWKILHNKERDRYVNEYYNNLGWHILRIWEHEFKQNNIKVVEKITIFIENAKLSENNKP